MTQQSLLPNDSFASAVQAKPFVKWVGGKRSLLPELLARVPDSFKNYYEPFLGGGALFFALKNLGKLDLRGGGGGRTFLSDVNFDLINTYQVIQRDPEPLIAKLRIHAEKHSKAHYYQVRSQHDLDDRIAIAARFIYLNKTCFNGLWRVNSKGEFNVPMGSAVKPAICQADNLRACHIALQSVLVRKQSFEALDALDGDFVYMDPPYHPLDGGSFTDYSKSGFATAEQIALRDFCVELTDKGALIMLSNSDTPFVRDLYAGCAFKIERVKAPRMVNSNASARGPVNELLIRNYCEKWLS